MKKRKNGQVSAVLLIFIAVGLIMLLIGIWLGIRTFQFGQTAEEVTAMITRVERHRDSDGDVHHDVYVDYYFQGQAYEDVRLSEYSSGMHEGKEILLLCDPENPWDARSKSMRYMLPLIMGMMGAVFILIPAIPIVNEIRRKKQREEIMAAGCILQGKVESVERNISLKVNGRSPYVIYCSYQDAFSGVIYHFKSDNLWTNPRPVYGPGSEIEIYVKEQDYSQYYVAAEEGMQAKIVDFT